MAHPPMPGLPSARRRRACGAVALASLAAFAALYLGLVHSLAGQRRDVALGNALAHVDDLVGGLLYSVGIAWLVVLALIAWHGWTTAGRRATVLAVGVGIAVVVMAEVLKLLLPRPQLPFEDAGSGFPSGHTAVVGALAVTAVTLTSSSRRWRVAVAWAVVQLLVAWGLVADRWHRPSDVVGSILLTLAAGAVAEGWIRPLVRSDGVRTISSVPSLA